jgi:hypothetical protein
MSDEPKRKRSWRRLVDWSGAALSVLAGALLGGFFGVDLFCQLPRAGFRLRSARRFRGRLMRDDCGRCWVRDLEKLNSRANHSKP